jgi:hypothetical protein
MRRGAGRTQLALVGEDLAITQDLIFTTLSCIDRAPEPVHLHPRRDRGDVARRAASGAALDRATSRGKIRDTLAPRYASH